MLAVVDAAENTTMEIMTLRSYFDHAIRHASSEKSALVIAQAIDTVLAKLELRLPAELHGASIRPAESMTATKPYRRQWHARRSM